MRHPSVRNRSKKICLRFWLENQRWVRFQDYDTLSVLCACHVRSNVVWGLMRHPDIWTCRDAKKFSFRTNLDPEVRRISPNAKTCKCHVHVLTDLMYLEAWCDTHTICRNGKKFEPRILAANVSVLSGRSDQSELELEAASARKMVDFGARIHCRTVNMRELVYEKILRSDLKEGHRGSRNFECTLLIAHICCACCHVRATLKLDSPQTFKLGFIEKFSSHLDLEGRPNQTNNDCKRMPYEWHYQM